DLILRLKRLDTEVLVLRKLMQNVRRRSDRIAAVKKRPACKLRACDETERSGLIAGYVAVFARLDLGLAYVKMGSEDFRRLGIVEAGLESLSVGDTDLRHLRKTLIDPLQCRLERAIVEPVHEPESIEVLAALLLLVRNRNILERFESQSRDRKLEEAIA